LLWNRALMIGLMRNIQIRLQHRHGIKHTHPCFTEASPLIGLRTLRLFPESAGRVSHHSGCGSFRFGTIT
jgi:hypothetical protein